MSKNKRFIFILSMNLWGLLTWPFSTFADPKAKESFLLANAITMEALAEHLLQEGVSAARQVSQGDIYSNVSQIKTGYVAYNHVVIESLRGVLESKRLTGELDLKALRKLSLFAVTPRLYSLLLSEAGRLSKDPDDILKIADTPRPPLERYRGDYSNRWHRLDKEDYFLDGPITREAQGATVFKPAQYEDVVRHFLISSSEKIIQQADWVRIQNFELALKQRGAKPPEKAIFDLKMAQIKVAPTSEALVQGLLRPILKVHPEQVAQLIEREITRVTELLEVEGARDLLEFVSKEKELKNKEALKTLLTRIQINRANEDLRKTKTADEFLTRLFKNTRHIAENRTGDLSLKPFDDLGPSQQQRAMLDVWAAASGPDTASVVNYTNVDPITLLKMAEILSAKSRVSPEALATVIQGLETPRAWLEFFTTGAGTFLDNTTKQKLIIYSASTFSGPSDDPTVLDKLEALLPFGQRWKFRSNLPNAYVSGCMVYLWKLMRGK